MRALNPCRRVRTLYKISFVPRCLHYTVLTSPPPPCVGSMAGSPLVSGRPGRGNVLTGRGCGWEPSQVRKLVFGRIEPTEVHENGRKVDRSELYGVGGGSSSGLGSCCRERFTRNLGQRGYCCTL